MWAFMEYGLVPDIVTVGKGLGNGYPMGAVICSQTISDKLGGYFSTFGGNPVSCAIGELDNMLTDGLPHILLTRSVCPGHREEREAAELG